MRNNKRHLNAGFTLMEVVFALVVLGGSLVVLLGLQSSLITRSVRDENQEQAILLTRHLLATLEAEVSSIEPTEITGTFREVYPKMFPDGAGAEFNAGVDFDRFMITYTISPWKIEGFPDDVMRKVTVTVKWGESSVDKVTTNYFFPKI